jgi:hypothetical protein
LLAERHHVLTAGAGEVFLRGEVLRFPGKGRSV